MNGWSNDEDLSWLCVERREESGLPTILVCRAACLRDCILQQKYEVPVRADTWQVKATATAHDTLRGGCLLRKHVSVQKFL